MPTTITPITQQGSIPASGTVTLPLPTSSVPNANIAPYPYLETGTANGIDFLRITIVLHPNTRKGDTIQTYFKTNTTPSSSFPFAGDIVDEPFESREISGRNGKLVQEFTLENIKNLGMKSGKYRLSYVQTSSSGKIVVASLNNDCLINVV
ncbi:hypothetical protein [Pseudomonas fitomaticsae]|uniref:Uncharacterized protein n=1 Tax=Pseudomonas fitomaticsae TaxID=2837969 RepID=A0ABY3Q1C6_9PSED|nr:hypothetical protein [Pseudomonas fitomaticsae]UFP99850.1 hypothetical protein KJY40_28225 [Pseudomonas fitomaticsae]